MVCFSWHSVFKEKKVNTSLFILIEKESQESLIEESTVPGFETKTKVCLNPQAGPWTDAKHPGSGLPPRGMAYSDPRAVGVAGPVCRGWLCGHLVSSAQGPPNPHRQGRIGWSLHPALSKHLWQRQNSRGPERGIFSTRTTRTAGARAEGSSNPR